MSGSLGLPKVKERPRRATRSKDGAMILNRKRQTEMRRYRRVPVDFPARVIVNGMDEHAGRILNMSPGDLAVRTEAQVIVGDAAVVYVAGLDVFEGTAARVFPDGFALSFRLSRGRRALVTERLMKIANPRLAAGLDAEDRRGALRHSGGGQRVICRMPDGSALIARVLETSAEGVCVEAPRRPPVGADIHIGRLRGVVMRHTHRGFVVAYDHGWPAESDTDAGDIGPDDLETLTARFELGNLYARILVTPRPDGKPG